MVRAVPSMSFQIRGGYAEQCIHHSEGSVCTGAVGEAERGL